jgi:Xaa-Pro dipeptidase
LHSSLLGAEAKATALFDKAINRGLVAPGRGERELSDATPDITGEQLYRHVLDLIADAGWGHGTTHAGHLVGEFPHEKINGDDIDCYITDGSVEPMRRPDAQGRPCHWILEVHLTDTERAFGGFFEQLLDI